MNDIYLTYDYDISDINKKFISNGIDKNFYLRLREEMGQGFRYMEWYPEISDYGYFKTCKFECLPDSARYIYIIPFKGYGYFIQKFKNFKLTVPDTVLNDVNTGRAIVLIDYSGEGDLLSSVHFSEFLKVIDNLPIPKNKLFLTHCDLKSENYCNYNFTYLPFPFNINFSLFNKFENSDIIGYNPSKLFVSYNRRIHGRFHRVLLLAYLNKKNLLDTGIVSIGDSSNIGLSHVEKHVNDLTEEDMKIFSDRLGNFPDLKDKLKYFNIDLGQTLNLEHHQNSFLSLVNETLSNTESIYFSEKIFKPIAIGHPFIINGNPQSLKYLRKMGFKTFNNYWDESYDDEMSVEIRVKKIVTLISELNKLNDSIKIKMRQDMTDILTHNKNNFYELRRNFKLNVTELINSLF